MAPAGMGSVSLLTPHTLEDQGGLLKALSPDCALVGAGSQAAEEGEGSQVVPQPAGCLLPSLLKAT